MKTQKMSLKNIKDVLSRDEMKEIMAGSYTLKWGDCCSSGDSHFGHWVSSCCYIPYGGSGEVFCC